MTSRSAENVTTGAPALEIKDVVAGYGGGDVLHGVSMQVYEGGITCVVGPNGAGKSTLLGTISGLLNPRLGHVSLRGERLSGKSPRQVLDMGVVLVPQNHSLFREMTVRENIVLGGYILRQRGLADRRLDHVLEMFPQVTEWLGKKAGSLSGGQQRLVEFARCLMLDPSLVILDEPSMGLSPLVLKSVFDAVRLMNKQGKTILLVEQNARAGLRLSTHGVVLENGRVRLAGSGREVLHHPEIGALYLGGAVTDAVRRPGPRGRERERGGRERGRRGDSRRGRGGRGERSRRERRRVERHRCPLIIDAHCHVIVPEMTARSVPEAWRPALRTEDGQRIVGFRGRELTSAVGEFSDVEIMLADAASTGIGHLLLSPWINLVPVDAQPDEARLVCRVQNESLARLVAAHPGRLSAVGAVCVQDPALAARELADLMTVPGLHGVEIPSSVGGRYLGDDFFLPFWAAAAETGALVFIHPSTRGFGIPALDGYYLWNSVGNPLETAITAAHIAVAGVLERFPQLRILLAHGGGALPVLRGRLRRAHAIRPEASERLSQGPDVSLRRFHYDTVTHDEGLLADLVRYAGPEQVLLGSDRPFDMGTDHPADEVRALRLGPGEDLILGGNAARLLGIDHA